MSLVLKDRVRETTTVLGTSDATLLGAVTGFQAFSVVGNGNTCYYTISDQSGGNWEVGIGTYSTVGPTLARTTILASSNSGSIVSFPAGTKDVFLTLPAEVAVVSSNNPSTAGYVLSSNGTGVAPSWVAGTSITVGAAGSNTQVQYNNSGVLGASSNFTFDGTNIGLAGGTANGVAYLNGSKVLTTGSALTFDGTNFQISGSTPTNKIKNTSSSGFAQIELNNDASQSAYIFQNGSTSTGYGGANSLNVYVVGNYPITFNTNSAEQMRLTSTGLGIGTSSPGQKLQVNGVVNIGNTTQNGGNLLYLSDYNNNASTFTTQIYLNSQNNGWGIGSSASRLGFGISSGYTAGSTLSSVLMQLDSSGNLGLGVTPSAWNSVYKVLQLGGGNAHYITSNSGVFGFTNNAYVGSGGATYITTGSAASRHYQLNGAFVWETAPSGTAGNAISFTQAMTLDASGNLGVGTSSPGYALDIRRGAGAEAYILLAGNNGGTSSGLIIGQDSAGASQLYQLGANPIRFATNGTERMRIDSSGNVGIGTSSPTQKLYVVGNGLFDGGFTYWTATVATPSSTSPAIWSPAIGEMGFWTNSAERMRITSSGKVGVGTNNPSAMISVATDTATAGYQYGISCSDYSTTTVALGLQTPGGSNFPFVYGNSGLGFGTNGTEWMRITSTGNVGIGTSSPAGKFQVAGGSGSTGVQAYFSSDAGFTAPAAANTSFSGGTKIVLWNDAGTPAKLSIGMDSSATMWFANVGAQLGGFDWYTSSTAGGSPSAVMSLSYDGVLSVTGGVVSTAGLKVTAASTRATLDAPSGDGRLQLSRDGTTIFGLNSASVNALRFDVNGTEKMRMDSNGNVGIGTSSPSVKFEVNSSVSGNVIAQVINPNSGGYGFYIQGGNGAQYALSCDNYGGVQLFKILGNGNLQMNSGYGSVATAYGCRAWVNFQGTGTVSIRASGNVSSITDNGTGDYTVNFTNAMPDTSYSVCGNLSYPQWGFMTSTSSSADNGTASFGTGSVRMMTTRYGGGTIDSTVCTVNVFR